MGARLFPGHALGTGGSSSSCAFLQITLQPLPAPAAHQCMSHHPAFVLGMMLLFWGNILPLQRPKLIGSSVTCCMKAQAIAANNSEGLEWSPANSNYISHHFNRGNYLIKKIKCTFEYTGAAALCCQRLGNVLCVHCWKECSAAFVFKWRKIWHIHTEKSIHSARVL